jgi:hypothetical protein
MALDEVIRKNVHTQLVTAVGDSEKGIFDLLAEATCSLKDAVAQLPRDASLAGLTISVHSAEVPDSTNDERDDLIEVSVAVGTVTYTTVAY